MNKAFAATGVPLARFILRMTVLSMVPAMLLSAAVHFALSPLLGLADAPPRTDEDLRLIPLFIAIVIAPIIESVIVIWLYTIVRQIVGSKSESMESVLVAFAMALFHAIFGPLWAIPVCWSFFVYIFGWRKWVEVNEGKGWVVLASPHIIQNATAYSLLALFFV